MTAVLGISAFYHDAAAALLIDGRIVAAAQEERFSRQKHDPGMPVRAIESCLREAGIDARELDYVGFYDKPLLKFERLLETYLAFAPGGFSSFAAAMPSWLHQKLHLPREIRRGIPGGFEKRVIFTDHHQSHAASAFFPSPFEQAAILTLDGVGEWATASIGQGLGNRIELTQELRFPHSLGLLYSAFTYFTGFKVNSDEYKLMGLAPYGEPRYVELILRHLVDLKADGSLRLDQRYFNYCQGLTMTSPLFDQLFEGPPRHTGDPITQREMDMAASVQQVVEEAVLRTARHLHRLTGQQDLCLAGGVALNCVANGRLLREGPFERIWIQPAADDAGGALGVALFIWHQLLGQERQPAAGDSMAGSLLGPAHEDDDVRALLSECGATYESIPDDGALCDRVADILAGGGIVGWFQGRMEFGPRALGSRSILGDARDPETQSRINRKVKFREGFRPFAPVVMAEHAHEYFGLSPEQDSPYMLLVAPVRESQRCVLSAEEAARAGLDRLRVLRSTIPSATHVDFSARVQTVPPESPELYRRLLERFYARTGCPVLVNTSFNLGWEPIVETPRQALDTFMSCDLDALVIGHHVVLKNRQPAWVERSAQSRSAVAGFDELLQSPCCGAALDTGDGGLVCRNCSHLFPVRQGIPQLFWPHDEIGDPTDVTERVKAFYEENPFPNYDDHDTLRALIDKSRTSIYARQLADAIPFNSTVLEVGCGTGQLSNFLGIGCRRVVATDLCLNSLSLGEEFRRREGLARVLFLQMNLFCPSIKPASFDVVLCNGVLHHTADPFGGFSGLVPLLKPGGIFVVGLYNQLGRLGMDLRRQVLSATGGRAAWIDPHLRSTRMSAAKRRAWLADQYRHPHESKHTMGEILGWFSRCGLEFVRGVPALSWVDDDLEESGLFSQGSAGGVLSRAAAQVRMISAGNREGGFFIMIGRKAWQGEQGETTGAGGRGG